MYFGSVSNGRDSQDLSSPVRQGGKSFSQLFFFFSLRKYISAGLSYMRGSHGRFEQEKASCPYPRMSGCR